MWKHHLQKTRTATFLSAIVLASSASAQSDLLSQMAGQGAGSLEVERLRPGLDENAILDVESGALRTSSGASWSLWFGYNRAPLRATWTADGKSSTIDLVGQRWGANLLSTIGINDGLQLGIDLPVVLFQSGSAAIPGSLETNPVARAGLGDLRLSPKLAWMRTDAGDVVDVAVVVHATLPTSIPRQQYIGDGLPTLAAELAVSRDDGAFRWAANFGPKLRFPSTFAGIEQGQELGYRLGMGYDFTEVWGLPIGLDASANGSLTWAPAFLPAHSNPVEALVGVHTQLGGLQYFVAAGAGLPSSGVGASFFRALGGLRYLPSCADADQDGFCDQDDACPEAAEDRDDFMDSDGCPDLDNDEDGIADGADQCPNEKEDADGFQDEDGCLDADNDEDGVLDLADRCPMVAGSVENGGCADVDQDHDGILDAADRCPEQAGLTQFQGCADTDQDGLPDPDDTCPNEAETQNDHEDDDGCPDTLPPPSDGIQLSEDQIDLGGRLIFESGMSTLKRSDLELLEKVAAVLLANPRILKVRIEGHTDSAGTDEVNMTLSIARAATVRDYLIGMGVSGERLEARGFGEARPVGDNRTPAGRETNRSVAFVIERTAP